MICQPSFWCGGDDGMIAPPTNPCMVGLVSLSHADLSTLGSQRLSPYQQITSLMLKEPRTHSLYKPISLTSLTHYGLMSSSKSTSTLTTFSLDIMPSNLMHDTLKPSAILTSHSTILLGPLDLQIQSVPIVTGYLLMNLTKKPCSSCILTRQKSSLGIKKFIIGQFSPFGGDSSLHHHVIDLDCAIRLWVIKSNDVSLTSYDQLRDFITQHMIIRCALSSSCFLTVSRSKHQCLNLSNSEEVCKICNLRCCMSEACRHKHSCAICGQCHQVKSCGGTKRSDGAK